MRLRDKVNARIFAVRDELRDFEGMVPQRDYPLFYFLEGFFVYPAV